jgi:hypothetical protein
MPRDDEIKPSGGTLSASGAAAVGGTDPMEPYKARISALKSKIDSIPVQVRLSDVRDAVENVETTSNRVADLANKVRELGYAWEKDLEPRCLDYRRRWQDLKPQVLTALDRESAALSGRVTQITYQGNYALSHATNPATADQELADGEKAVNGLLNEAAAAARTIRGMFDQFANDLNQEQTRLEKIQAMLERAAQSKIAWLPGEALVVDVKAKWDRDGNDDAQGYLYLTDARLIFERDEQIATKKVLFIATEKQRVQQVLLETKVGEIENVLASKRGIFGNEDHLDFTFGGSTAVRSAHFHIDGQDANEWQGRVQRVKTGGMESTRVAALSDAEKQRLKNAPTKCPTCGSPLTAPVLRGQTEIKCPACGTVTRF